MFSSPTLSRTNKQHAPMDRMTTKRVVDDKSQTIEQLKTIIDELQLRHERKERELLKRIGILYHDLQQNRKKMAHLIYKHQQQKKFNDDTKFFQDLSTQTENNHLSSICPHCSTQLSEISQCYDENLVEFLHQLQIREQQTISEQAPKYYTLQPEDNVEYISATPQVPFNPSLSSPSLSTTDRSSSSTSSTKHNESSSSAYNTAESLPSSSTYSDDIESLERVLNAACTMYTTHDNLEHTIKLQEELFRQRLRLRGIAVDDDDGGKGHNSSSSEHLYDNIDGETSDVEKQVTGRRNRLIQGHQKIGKTNLTLSTDDDEQQQQYQHKMKPYKVRFLDQAHSMNKRKNLKSFSRANLAKSTHQKRSNSNQLSPTNNKLTLPLSSNMLTVTIT